MATATVTGKESTSRANGAGRTAARARARAGEARDALHAASTQAGEAVDSVRQTLPKVARASRGFVDDAMRRIETGSDEQVSAGVTMSLGLAIGMLLGGAPRLLIAAALVPVAAMGIVLMDRRTHGGPSSPTPRGA